MLSSAGYRRAVVERGSRVLVAHRVALTFLLAATGFTALALQVVWQRLVSLHLGVDTSASAVVVAGFLTGLGVGTLVGGRLADRCSLRRAVTVVAAAEAGVAAFALASPWLLHGLFHGAFQSLAGRPAGAVVTFVILAVPTSLMGLSLPLIARVVAHPVATAGQRAGHLYAANTAGGALGALVGGWYLVGTHGYAGSARGCALAGAVSAVALFGLARTLPAGSARPERVPGGGARQDGVRPGRVVPYLLLYGLTGALALGLQQTFFRLVGATMRSNSYSFATVLALHLTAFAAGAAIGARLVRRSREPLRVFLWLQGAVGITALGSVLFVTSVLPVAGFGSRFDEWFNSDGFASGFDFSDPGSLTLFALVIPAVFVVPPVALMGASFPFVEQGLVERLGLVGRTTGGLIAANTFGNVAGVILTGFVLVNRLGTAGTHRVLGAALAVIGLVAAMSLRARRWRPLVAGSVGLLSVSLVVATPSNVRMWAFFSGSRELDRIMVAEDATCASIVERHGPGQFQLAINGTSQNGYPFDDFHVLIGLVPSLVSARPDRALAVGFGIGSTSYALLADERRRQVTTVELCSGHYDLARRLADEGHREFVEIFSDRRHRALVGDGRHHLAVTGERYDAVVVDTLRVTSAGSGQHLSREFYELVASSLTDDGVFVQWVPTLRTLNSAAQVFPHLVTLTVPQYNDSVFMIGSRHPVEVTPSELVHRFDRRAASAFSADQRARLREFLAAWAPSCINNGKVVIGVPTDFDNRDLDPRDEFHLNNGFIGEAQTYGTCPGAPVGTVVPGRVRGR